MQKTMHSAKNKIEVNTPELKAYFSPKKWRGGKQLQNSVQKDAVNIKSLIVGEAVDCVICRSSKSLEECCVRWVCVLYRL